MAGSGGLVLVCHCVHQAVRGSPGDAIFTGKLSHALAEAVITKGGFAIDGDLLPSDVLSLELGSLHTRCILTSATVVD